MEKSNIEEIIEDYRRGKMVIIMDDENRENEGDLCMAATQVTAEDVNFMARYGRGLICLTLTRERCQQLRLPLMVAKNGIDTNFTVSVEASSGVTTGISAADRAHTILAAVAPNAAPEDLTQPGHIFPLMAQAGGVLTRAGHTEGGCDLARLAGLEPASVIVEILNEDGSMARRPDLEKFAEEHDLKLGTIADLIHYRIENEKTVERVAECQLHSEYGDFRLISYEDAIDHKVHVALVKGTVSPDQPILVRVHMQDMLCDLLHSKHPDCGLPLSDAMKKMAAEEQSVLVVLRKNDDDRELLRRIENFHIRNNQVAVDQEGQSDDLRTYGLGAQILSDLGVRKMRVLGAPRKMHGLSGFGLEVVEYIYKD